MAIFERHGLLSDPEGFEMDLRGEPADSIRVSLTDACLVPAAAARRLFSATAEIHAASSNG